MADGRRAGLEHRVSILDEILANKRQEIEAAKARHPAERLLQMLKAAPPDPPRDFYKAVVSAGPRPALIAEVKAASPSAGVIAEDFDPARTARAYAAAGAAALSVLTDEKYFRGRLGHIRAVKNAVELPVLRKDFIIDEYQIVESRAAGADAILLIAEALEMGAIYELAQDACEEWGMSVLLEVHSAGKLREVLAVRESLSQSRYGAPLLIGINNRDLKTQTISLEATEKVAPLIPDGVPFIAESGIKTAADVERMRAAGACGLLIGETLMRTGDPGAAMAALGLASRAGRH